MGMTLRHDRSEPVYFKIPAQALDDDHFPLGSRSQPFRARRKIDGGDLALQLLQLLLPNGIHINWPDYDVFIPGDDFLFQVRAIIQMFLPLYDRSGKSQTG